MAHLSLTERDEFRVSLFVFRYGVKAETGVHHSGVCAVILVVDFRYREKVLLRLLENNLRGPTTR